jgi:hypothetical protein
MVPIPEGAERSEEEPENEDYSGISQSDGGSSSTSPLNSTPNLVTSTTNVEPVPSISTANLSSATELPQGTGKLDLGRLTLGSGDEEDEIRG